MPWPCPFSCTFVNSILNLCYMAPPVRVLGGGALSSATSLPLLLILLLLILLVRLLLGLLILLILLLSGATAGASQDHDQDQKERPYRSPHTCSSTQPTLSFLVTTPGGAGSAMVRAPAENFQGERTIGHSSELMVSLA
jgi:hypothetical protein